MSILAILRICSFSCLASPKTLLKQHKYRIVENATPVFLGNTHRNETGTFDVEFQALQPRDWAMGILAIGKTEDIRKVYIEITIFYQ